jgi:hypothetical protein
MDDDYLHIRILTRAKANPTDRAEIRRRSLYLRYFLRKAFRGYRADQIDLKLAFYLDHGLPHASWRGEDRIFHPEEMIDRTHFWNDLCPGANPEELFARIRAAATKGLQSENVVTKLKEHFNRSQANQDAS